MNQYNTIGFHPGNSRIHQLNATVKLLFLLVVSISAMVTYDTRYLILISASSILLFNMLILNGNKFALLLNSFCFSQY